MNHYAICESTPDYVNIEIFLAEDDKAAEEYFKNEGSSESSLIRLEQDGTGTIYLGAEIEAPYVLIENEYENE